MPNPVDSAVVTVATAGTAVQVSTTSRKVIALTVRARAANTGNMFAGGSDVDNTKAPLDASDSVSFVAPQSSLGPLQFDLTSIWIDASVNGEIADVFWLEL